MPELTLYTSPRACSTACHIALAESGLEVDRRLAGKPFALGERYSVVDPYLLVFWIWSQREDIVADVADMPNWHAQAQRVLAREATWPCLEREGITPQNIASA